MSVTLPSLDSLNFASDRQLQRMRPELISFELDLRICPSHTPYKEESMMVFPSFWRGQHFPVYRLPFLRYLFLNFTKRSFWLICIGGSMPCFYFCSLFLRSLLINLSFMKNGEFTCIHFSPCLFVRISQLMLS